jgi:hypothetical protein
MAQSMLAGIRRRVRGLVASTADDPPATHEQSHLVLSATARDDRGG